MFIKTKARALTKDVKIKSLTRAIQYFSQPHIEEYEKCTYMKNILDKLI